MSLCSMAKLKPLQLNLLVQQSKTSAAKSDSDGKLDLTVENLAPVITQHASCSSISSVEAAKRIKKDVEDQFNYLFPILEEKVEQIVAHVKEYRNGASLTNVTEKIKFIINDSSSWLNFASSNVLCPTTSQQISNGSYNVVGGGGNTIPVLPSGSLGSNPPGAIFPYTIGSIISSSDPITTYSNWAPCGGQQLDKDTHPDLHDFLKVNQTLICQTFQCYYVFVPSASVVWAFPPKVMFNLPDIPGFSIKIN